jgi:hypothetical protein
MDRTRFEQEMHNRLDPIVARGMNWLAWLGCALIIAGIFLRDSHTGIYGMLILIYCKLDKRAV